MTCEQIYRNVLALLKDPGRSQKGHPKQGVLRKLNRPNGPGDIQKSGKYGIEDRKSDKKEEKAG
jgi:hypothetical protein